MLNPNDQWLEARLIVRAELKFDVRSVAGKSHAVIEDPVRSKFFQIGLDEYEFIAALNGDLSVAEIANQQTGDRRLDETQAITIAQWLVQNNLVYGREADSSKRLGAQAQMVQRAKMMSWVNPISCKFKLFNPNTLLTKIQPYTQWMFSGWLLVVWILVGAYATTVLFSNWGQLGSASAGIFAGTKWIWLLLIWLGLKIVHETAHGIACRRYGGEVPEAGVLLLLFTPMAYVNVTSMWRFANRWHRIVVAAAGMYVEIFISFVAIIIWQARPGIVGDIAFDVFIMSSVTTILFNANPLMRFDGYFILSDLLQIPNLYTKGTKWFGDRLKSLIFGLPKTPNICPPDETRRVAIYGSMAFFWKFTISFSLIIAASVLFYGAGLVLAAMGIVLWFGIPITNQLRSIFGSKAQHSIDRKRLALSCTVTAVVGLSMFYVLKAPASKSAPAIVQFSSEQIVRAKADGFIRKIIVENGQSVKTNQILLVIENRQLMLDLVNLQQRAIESKIKSRIHSQNGELPLAQTALELHDGLLEQIDEKRDEVDGLTLRAPFDGIVYERNLANQLNGFVRHGDPLLSIAQAETKEVVVSIDQRDLESMKGNEGKMLRVAFPGLPVFESPVSRIDLRATNRPQHPSLCANVGGSLPVKPVAARNEKEKSGVELLDPRFTVELKLDPNIGSQLQSGQRGRAFFATNTQSLGSYLIVAASDWLEDKIELATQTAVF